LRQAKDPDSGLAGAVCPFSISSPSDSSSSILQMLVGSSPSGQVNMTVLSGCSSAGSGWCVYRQRTDMLRVGIYWIESGRIIATGQRTAESVELGIPDRFLCAGA
jgi:hypothetical protein